MSTNFQKHDHMQRKCIAMAYHTHHQWILPPLSLQRDHSCICPTPKEYALLRLGLAISSAVALHICDVKEEALVEPSKGDNAELVDYEHILTTEYGDDILSLAKTNHLILTCHWMIPYTPARISPFVRRCTCLSKILVWNRHTDRVRLPNTWLDLGTYVPRHSSLKELSSTWLDLGT